MLFFASSHLHLDLFSCRTGNIKSGATFGAAAITEEVRDLKFLIMTAAFGTGHNQVAIALADAAVEAGHAATVIDALAVGAPYVSKWMTSGFIRLLNSAPGLYRAAYTRMEVPGQLDIMKSAGIATLTKLIWGPLSALLGREQPDVIVCTHPFVLGVLAYLRRTGRLHTHLAGVLTDFAPHALWLHAGVDMYYVARPEMVNTMAAQGVDPQRFQATGIPIRPAFMSAPQRLAAARELGLDAARPTVLMMGGGLGLGPMREMIAAARQAALPLQILAVTGHNQRLYAELAPLCGLMPGTETSVHLYGYVADVHRLMAASDLLVSKPGAVTTSEALALGLPMLLMPPIPGQEERNAAVLVASGAARPVPEPAALAAALRELLSDPAALLAMRQAARATAQPRAARLVVADLALLQPQGRIWSA
jgi:processive 1,2-diacylglycerol beta-glucosyltransferase